MHGYDLSVVRAYDFSGLLNGLDFRYEQNEKNPRSEHEELFNRQIRTLASAGCPQGALDALLCQKEYVLSEAIQSAKNARGIIPFVPVVTERYIGLREFIGMVEIFHQHIGYTHFHNRDIYDSSFTQIMPYYLLHVETGGQTLGQRLNDAQETIAHQRRLLLTARETVALAMHSDALLHYDLAADTKCSKTGRALEIYRSKAGPGLGYSDSGSSNRRRVHPSCEKRI